MFMTATVAAVVIFLCGVMVGGASTRHGPRRRRRSLPNPRGSRPPLPRTSKLALGHGPFRRAGLQPGRSQGTDLRQAARSAGASARACRRACAAPVPAVETAKVERPPVAPTATKAVDTPSRSMRRRRGAGRAQGEWLRGSGRLAAFAWRGRRDRAPPVVEGLSVFRLHARLERSDACSASASANTATGARPRPSPDGWKRKNSSSPGSRAEASRTSFIRVLDSKLTFASELLPLRSQERCSRSVSPLRSSSICLGRPCSIAACAERVARTARTAAGQPARRAFWFGMVTGLVYFAGTVYWTSRCWRSSAECRWHWPSWRCCCSPPTSPSFRQSPRWCLRGW